jgi:hypothetical protein
MSRLITVLICALFAAGPGAAAEKIYKWTDKDGVVHYGSTPPDAADATQMKVSTAVSAPIETPPADPNAPKTDGPLGKQFADNCRIARANVAALEGQSAVAQANADGTPGAELNAEQRAAQLKNAQEQVTLFCK